MANDRWAYSHTQLDLWRLCKRRWWRRYVKGVDEPTTPNMAAGTWLAQYPLETVAQNLEFDEARQQGAWANFLAAFGGGEGFKSDIFTPELPKQVLEAYKQSPVQGKVVDIERTFELELLGGYFYTSRPDLVVDVETPATVDPRDSEPFAWIKRTTWDIKLKTFNQTKVGDTFFMKPELSKFDDQCLGQAILAGADAFGQIQFWLGKKDGVVRGPFYVEHPVDPVLADEWRGETSATILEIEQWRKTTHASWPKSEQGCKAFGRECPGLAECNFGWVPLDNSKQKG